MRLMGLRDHIDGSIKEGRKEGVYVCDHGHSGGDW